MKIAAGLIFTSILLFSFFTFTNGETQVLTSSNFFDKIQEGDWFIKFYAPWCGHCKRLAPIWEDLGRLDSGANIATVDCTNEGSLCKAFEIRGYPTLKFISGGKQYAYKGARELAKLRSYIKNKEYLESETSDLPSSTLPYDNEFIDALKVIQAWAKENIILSLGFTAFFFLVIGICLGTIFNMLLVPLPNPTPVQNKPQNESAEKKAESSEKDKKDSRIEKKNK